MGEDVKKIHTPFELFYTEGLSDVSGWAGLVRIFLHKVKKFNENKPENEQALITQIKEKWGSLCLYSYLPKELDDYRQMAEHASNHICEHCGSPFHVGKYQGGWIETVCETCAKNENKYEPNYHYHFTSGKKDTDEYQTYDIYSGEKNNLKAWEKLIERLQIKHPSPNDLSICKTINRGVTCCNKEIACISGKVYRLEYVEKYDLWKEYNHSVKMDCVIRFALKVQKIKDKIEKKYSYISYKYWKIKRYFILKYKTLWD